MEYAQEVLDRTTGQLKTQSLGDWITVTELGLRHGAGKRSVRAVLHHMGVLAREGRCYRLSRHLVEVGFGMRHDFPRSGHAFDVISPKGQETIASLWSAAVQDYQESQKQSSLVPDIRAALVTFATDRLEPMTAQEEACWVLDHFQDVDHLTIAKVLEVSPALVSRYAKKRAKDRAACERRKQDVLPVNTGLDVRMGKWASSGSIYIGE
ncbi:hypothetical protein [Bosea sp. NBC_00550]|uniref:hypothetical protein n=1 Tax=Bosea sp. NBC_00550 TaxID=2969621 RepID=UPI002232A0AB|nr:hypothetical protein [Bosea sp. NBC_00550]UZF91740.1 hypothetical protein NWE53_21935 [Bosea sp. NBC_00550]